MPANLIPIQLNLSTGTLVAASGGSGSNPLVPSGTGYVHVTGGILDIIARTAAQITNDLSIFSAVTQGVVPASGGGISAFLRADGTWVIPPNTTGSVGSFNTRTGAVTLLSSDVVTALGFVPYNNSNPSNFITSAVTSAIAGTGVTVSAATGTVTFANSGVLSLNTRTGAVTLLSSDVVTALTYTPLNKAGDIMAANANLSFSGGTITNLPTTPTNPNDAASKAYVDAVSEGLIVKQSVVVATTGPITISNPGTAVFDSITVSSGSRILVKSQTNATENGIYIFNGNTSALTRSSDMPIYNSSGPTPANSTSWSGSSVFIEEGTLFGVTTWVLTTTNPIQIGTTNISWTQFSGSTGYLAGTGLSLVGTTFNNTGVISNIAGTGISVSGSTGDITISNIGVTGLVAGTGVTISGATGIITISAIGGVSSVAATAGSGISISGSPITSSGTLVITNTGVTSFNTRVGNISLTSSDVITSLGFTPVSSSLMINTTAPLSGGASLSGDLTLSISTFGSAQSGIVPLSGGGTTNFLRADGTWAAPPGTGGGGSVTSLAAATPIIVSASTGNITISVSTFGTSNSGIVPASGGGTTNFLRADGAWVPGGSGGSGSVTSVAATGSTGLVVGGSPITTTGTLTFTLGTELQGLSALASNGFVQRTGAGTYSASNLFSTALTANAFVYSNSSSLLTPVSASTNGQLLIGSTGVSPVVSVLTAGSGITIVNGPGSITISTTGTLGTVTSVAATGSTGLTVGGSPITTSGTLTFTLSSPLQAFSTLGASTSTGLITQTGISTFTDVTITGTANDIVVTNGAGIFGNPTIDLATVTQASTGTTFVKIAVDTKGRVVSNTAVIQSDIVSLISSLYLPVSGGIMSGSITFLGSSGITVTGLPAPINPSDAATKSYVDASIAGLSWKQAVAVATTVNLTASYNNGSSGVGATLTNTGTQAAFVVDAYATSVNDRILVKNQLAPLQNGLYIVSNIGSGSTNWILIRSSDANQGAQIFGATVYVDQGTVNANTAWTQTTTSTIAIGTTGIGFAQFSGSGSYAAGTGLSLVGNTFSLITPISIALGGTGLITTPTNGQIDIGNGSGFTRSTLTQGLGITITNGSGTITIANTGVTSTVAGTGISVSGATGAVTISNTGVLSVTGTANQITASSATGAVTLSLPAAVTLGTSLTISGLTANSFLYSGTAGLLTTTVAPTNGQLLIGSTGSAPTLATLTAGTAIGITNAVGSITVNNTGVTSLIAGSGVTISSATGNITISASSGGTYTAGSGLTVASNIFSLNYGAGISALPTNDVGINVFTPSVSALILTTTGTARDTSVGGGPGTTAKLALLLASSGGLTQDATGLYVPIGGIINPMFQNPTTSLTVTSGGAGALAAGGIIQILGDSTAGVSTTLLGGTVTGGYQTINPTVVVTVANASATQKGVAQFSTDFTVTSGNVSLSGTSTVTNVSAISGIIIDSIPLALATQISWMVQVRNHSSLGDIYAAHIYAITDGTNINSNITNTLTLGSAIPGIALNVTVGSSILLNLVATPNVDYTVKRIGYSVI